MSIAANELRIGNFVFHCPFGTDAKISVQVKVIKEDKINEDAMFLELVEPIPITPDILIAYGFIRQLRKYNGTFYHTGVWFSIRHKTSTDKYYYITYKNSGIELKYLHQLQNLHFALTGNELVYNT